MMEVIDYCHDYILFYLLRNSVNWFHISALEWFSLICTRMLSFEQIQCEIQVTKMKRPINLHSLFSLRCVGKHLSQSARAREVRRVSQYSRSIPDAAPVLARFEGYKENSLRLHAIPSFRELRRKPSLVFITGISGQELIASELSFKWLQLLAQYRQSTPRPQGPFFFSFFSWQTFLKVTLWWIRACVHGWQTKLTSGTRLMMTSSFGQSLTTASWEFLINYQRRYLKVYVKSYFIVRGYIVSIEVWEHFGI